MKRSPTRSFTAWGLVLAGLLVQLPFLDRGISLHDEGSILAIGDALLAGEVLYRDRVTTLPPLIYELMGLLFASFGPSLIVARVFQMLVFVGCVVLVYAISKTLAGPRVALMSGIAVLALKPLGFRLWTMASYSHLAMLLCLTSLWLTLLFMRERKTVWLIGAGLGAGLALLAKQNLGAVFVVAVALALLLDGLSEPEDRVRRLLARGGAWICAVLVPTVSAAILYAASGAAGAFLEQTTIRAALQRPSYWVPPPGLGLWSWRAEGVGENAFTYFPAPLFNLGWHGDLSLFSGPLAFSIELFVKAAYYVPVLAFVAGVLALVRAQGRPAAHLLVVVFGGLAYASMLHRADWAHLMNVFPALILLCAVALTGSRRARGLGIAVWALWIGAAVATTPAVLAAYRTPVDSPRGRLLGTPSRARETQQVLTYLAQQPLEQRILILRGEPLYYFLSGRRIPARFDLLVPGLFAPQDDPEFVAALRDVDQVIYNPRESALVPRPLVAYAPATAAALARGFRIVETLGDVAVVLRPADAAARERTVVDLWESSEEFAATERTSWLMYRVLAVDLETEGESCFEQRHRAAKGESVTAVPIFHPRTWLPLARDSGPVRFSIRVEGQTSEHEGVPGVPGPPLRLPLDSFAEREIEIRFCVSAPGAAPDAMNARELGWAEARIVRAP